MLVTGLAQDDITRMRDQLFFEGPERNRRLSRFWLLLPLAAVIASAGVVSDSTATVIGAMIVAPLMTPILGIVLAVALTDGPNLRRCLLLVIVGAAAVVALGWLLGRSSLTRSRANQAQVTARTTLQVADLLAALATKEPHELQIAGVLRSRARAHVLGMARQLRGCRRGRRRPTSNIWSVQPVPTAWRTQSSNTSIRNRPYPPGETDRPVTRLPSWVSRTSRSGGSREIARRVRWRA